jgi:membrane protein
VRAGANIELKGSEVRAAQKRNFLSVIRGLRDLYHEAVEIYFRFLRHHGFLLSAGIAFFAFLSIFPLFLLLGILQSYLFKNPQVQQEILAYILNRIPSLTSVIKTNIEGLIQSRGSAGIIAVFGFIWSATGLLTSMSIALGVVYGVKETRNVVRHRTMAAIVLLLIFILFVVSFSATVLASVLRVQGLTEFLPPSLDTFIWTVVSHAIGLLSNFLLFFIVYRFIPNVKLKLRDIWLGTLLAGIAWEIEKYVLALYFELFGHARYGSIYGSLASIIVTMFWINISSMLFMLGAEINVLYNERRQARIPR